MSLIPNLDTFATNRLLTYLGISILTSTLAQLQLIASGDLVLDSGVKWGILMISIILQPAIVLRSFMDQSLSKKDE